MNHIIGNAFTSWQTVIQIKAALKYKKSYQWIDFFQGIMETMQALDGQDQIISNFLSTPFF